MALNMHDKRLNILLWYSCSVHPEKWHALYNINACENHYPGKWQAMHDADACENYIAIILRCQSPCFQMYAKTSMYCNTVALLLSICSQKCHCKIARNMYGNRKYLFRNKGYCYVYMWVSWSPPLCPRSLRCIYHYAMCHMGRGNSLTCERRSTEAN